jgi:hypothetical protein
VEPAAQLIARLALDGVALLARDRRSVAGCSCPNLDYARHGVFVILGVFRLVPFHPTGDKCTYFIERVPHIVAGLALVTEALTPFPPDYIATGMRWRVKCDIPNVVLAAPLPDPFQDFANLRSMKIASWLSSQS